MKKSGPIRRTERKTSRTAARRNSSPRFVSPPGTAPPGPDAHYSGPGSLLRIGPVKLFYEVAESVPTRVRIASHFTCSERMRREPLVKVRASVTPLLNCHPEHSEGLPFFRARDSRSFPFDRLRVRMTKFGRLSVKKRVLIFTAVLEATRTLRSNFDE